MNSDLFDRLVDRAVPFRFRLFWLRAWARLVFNAHKPQIVAITGSVGKTTTKEMIAAVLTAPDASRIIGKVHKTTGSFNEWSGAAVSLLQLPPFWNPVGMACTLLRAPFRALKLLAARHYPKVLVLECGIGEPGAMARITSVVTPDVAIVTTIGPSHLERLGSVEGVAREKGLLVEAVKREGLVILGGGHSFVEALARRSPARVIVCEGRGVELSKNIARVVAQHYGIPDSIAAAAMATYRPLAGRQRRLSLGAFTVIDDSYNANPLSMRYGLEMLGRESANRRVAILGSMGELGEASSGFHREIGQCAHDSAGVVIGVGEEARHYGPDHWFASVDELIANVMPLLQPGDVMLVKGSHSVHLERLVEHLSRTLQPVDQARSPA